MIIAAPIVLPMRQPGALIRNGAIAVQRGAIVSVGPAASLTRRFPTHRVVALPNAVLMPGLVNVHAHLELPPLLDAVRASSFPDWILNLIAAKKNLTGSDYSAAASENIDNLIKTGTTTVGEICTHDISPSLLKKSGLRAVIFRELITMKQNEGFLVTKKPFPLGRNTSRVHFGLSPHSPYTVSENALRSLAAYAQLRGFRLAMHVAESADEGLLLQRRKNRLETLYHFAGWDVAWAPRARSSCRYLNDIGFLSSRLLAVHTVHLSGSDIDLLKKAKCSVAHCPRSNQELGVGRMRLRDILDAGVNAGLGTDSLASCPNLNMWDEMRSAYRMHVRDGITPEQILALATKGGSQALGLSNIGSLESGKKADIIAAPLPGKNTGDVIEDLLRETEACTFSMVDGKMLRSPFGHR